MALLGSHVGDATRTDYFDVVRDGVSRRLPRLDATASGTLRHHQLDMPLNAFGPTLPPAGTVGDIDFQLIQALSATPAGSSGLALLRSLKKVTAAATELEAAGQGLQELVGEHEALEAERNDAKTAFQQADERLARLKKRKRELEAAYAAEAAQAEATPTQATARTAAPTPATGTNVIGTRQVRRRPDGQH